MNKKEKDDLFAAHLPGILSYHQQMLSDGVRNKLLFEVIKACVNSETNFLDIGAGTGVWAILAAKLGAKRSVAVEIEESLIPIIFRHAQENGVAQKVEIIHANADDVKIRGKFDVIVSEVFGGSALGAETINSFVQLRSRFLAPNGILIPQKLAMFAVPVKIEHSAQNIPADLPIKSEFLSSLKSNYFWNATLADRQKIKFLAEPKELVEIDFRTVETAPSLNNLSLSWQMNNLVEANAFAVFNYSTFSDDVKMDNFESQSWGTTIYEFQPFAEAVGELKFDLTIDENKSIWTVSLPSNSEVKPQTYSPIFAAARIKMAQQMTPHRRFKPPKIEKSKKKSR
jgi:SAM-dependent methyltransferase